MGEIHALTKDININRKELDHTSLLNTYFTYSSFYISKVENCVVATGTVESLV